ncbi:MAG: oxidoreductase [Planctomycetaceae bacterium]|nr:oxidoreductase [Planctomycetaceae bacterium]
MNDQLKRRRFLQSSAGLFAGLPYLAAGRVLGANQRLNVGVIGVGGRGAGDLAGVASENIVALCDVNRNTLDAAAAKFPRARRYSDYRDCLEQQNLDAVVVATPDHHHAPATMRALKRGLHVYCEKPLTHTVQEARAIANATREAGVATQMGTQNHEHPGYLRLVELLQSGAIGSVHEVHVITDRPGNFWKQGLERPTDELPIPAHLAWDHWLGPAARRSYHPAYVPFKWRGWWDFGCGAIGDMAIHLMDPAFWALELGGPVKVTSQGPPQHSQSGPTSMVTRFQFGQRGKLPPVDVVWYEGVAKPRAEIAVELPMNGSLFLGSQGRIAIQHGGFPTLLPKEKFVDYKAPDPYLPESPGHHRQWIEACKTGSRTGSNFQYAGPFTEVVLLGNVAYRVGETIAYDPHKSEVTNLPKANALLTKSYRTGWEL